MKQISPKEFKQMTLNMLFAFSKVCEQKGLRYVLDYGSLLGAIRHKGFIPWDDDIDVSMPREDYEKLYDLMERQPELMGPYFRLSSYRNKYSTQKPCHNIIDIRTITKSPNRIPKYYYPVWIDIFPMDALPAEKEKQKDIILNCNKLLHLCQVAYNPGKGFLKPIKRFIHSFELKHLQERLEKLDKIATSISNTDNMLTNYMSPYGLKDVSEISFYNDVIYCKFENGEFRIPKQFDKRLKNVYGNYMELPPENKRIPHVTEAFWLEQYKK